MLAPFLHLTPGFLLAPPQQPVSSSQEDDQESVAVSSDDASWSSSSTNDEGATQVSAHDDPDHDYTFSVEQYAKKKVCQGVGPSPTLRNKTISQALYQNHIDR
jgi:hypothetical protein